MSGLHLLESFGVAYRDPHCAGVLIAIRKPKMSLNVKDPEAHRLAQAIAQETVKPTRAQSRKPCVNATSGFINAIQRRSRRTSVQSPIAPPPRSKARIPIIPNTSMMSTACPTDPTHTANGKTEGVCASDRHRSDTFEVIQVSIRRAAQTFVEGSSGACRDPAALRASRVCCESFTRRFLGAFRSAAEPRLEKTVIASNRGVRLEGSPQ